MSKKGFFISLGAGLNQIPLIRTALDMGYPVIAADQNEDAPGFELADVKIYESTHEYRKIYKAIYELPRTLEISGVGCRSYGKATYSCAYLADKFKVRGIKPDTAKLFLNKREIRSVLEKKQVRMPVSYSWKTTALIQKALSLIKYPCIVKPVDGDGKKGVQYFSNKESLRMYLENNAPQENEILLEDFIEGDEVTIIGFVEKKKFFLISVIDKITSNTPPFIELSHRLPSRYEHLTDKFVKICQEIVSAFGLEFTPFLAEFKVTSSKEIYLIEAQPEVGGEYLAESLIPEFYDYDYFLNLIEMLTAQNPRYSIHRGSDRPHQSQLCFFLPGELPENFSNSNLMGKFQGNERMFFERKLRENIDFGGSIQGNRLRNQVIGVSSFGEISPESLDSSIRMIVRGSMSNG